MICRDATRMGDHMLLLVEDTKTKRHYLKPERDVKGGLSQFLLDMNEQYGEAFGVNILSVFKRFRSERPGTKFSECLRRQMYRYPDDTFTELPVGFDHTQVLIPVSFREVFLSNRLLYYRNKDLVLKIEQARIMERHALFMENAKKDLAAFKAKIKRNSLPRRRVGAPFGHVV